MSSTRACSSKSDGLCIKISFGGWNISENIFCIVVTLEVTKLGKFAKFNVFKLVQPENILCIVVTLLVSKLDKSKLVRVEQPANILDIFVTSDVFNGDRSIFSSDEQL